MAPGRSPSPSVATRNSLSPQSLHPDDYHEYFKRSFEEDIAAQVPQGVEWGYNY
ncbi:hypothetical protein ZEAMMB73_Zm00001d019031 [Zea mays]|uniref:Uncharacterized protein n=1 Tax=Zea mays TaxID=4577 RepID=A0A1D6HUE3_MAIZE|nr:hypothetical protein ZEAMMB73_Zm00001d019031 [Zea mays]